MLACLAEPVTAAGRTTSIRSELDSGPRHVDLDGGPPRVELNAGCSPTVREQRYSNDQPPVVPEEN